MLFSTLPTSVQEQIEVYLNAYNFRAARELYQKHKPIIQDSEHAEQIEANEGN